MALGLIVAHVAVAAVNLHVLVEHEVQRFTAGDLGNRRLDRKLLERRQQCQMTLCSGGRHVLVEHPAVRYISASSA